MDVLQVDPNELEIDPFNERTEDVGPDKDGESLEKSIKQQGVIEPPVVREDENGQYLVVVGQRRTLAAQAVGLDEMPVLLMDYDEAEAIQASITENIDAFRKSVSRSNRAKAVKELMDRKGWGVAETANQLGISRDTVARWLERTDDAWEGTSVSVDTGSRNTSQEDTSVEVESDEENSSDTVQKSVDEIPDENLATIRRATDNKQEREHAVKKVQEEGLAKRDIREAQKRAENSDDSFTEVIDTISQEKEERQEGGIKVEARVTVAGQDAEALREAAKDMGTSEEDVVRHAIEEFLDSKGYR